MTSKATENPEPQPFDNVSQSSRKPGIIQNAMGDYHKQLEEYAQQEAYLHERYASDLLNKHGLLPTPQDIAVWSSIDPLYSLLERKGYYMEHLVRPGDPGADIHQYRLFKVVDASPRYKVKRVVSVEEAGKEALSNPTTPGDVSVPMPSPDLGEGKEK